MAVLAVCLLAEAAAAGMLALTHGFWSPDSALRFIQVEQLAASGFKDLSVPYPAAGLDPAGRYFPLGAWFHFQWHGRFYLSYLPYFSMLAVPLFRAFGLYGLVIIPAAAALGAVWISYEAVRVQVPEFAWAAAAVLGLATPLFVYGIVYWDHTLAVLFAAAALMMLTRVLKGQAPAYSVAAAGAFLALGLWLRNEMYLFALATAVAWLVTRPRRALREAAVLTIGAAGPAAGLVLLNARLFGSPFGWKGHDLITTRMSGAEHAVTAGTPAAVGWITEKLSNAYYQIASPDFYAFNPAAITRGVALAVGLVLGTLMLIAGVHRRSRALLATGATIGSGLTIMLASDRTMVSGLLPVAPVVLLALAAGAGRPWERFLWMVIGLFTAGVLVTGTHGGLQWGPRYLLPVLPPLIWLAARGVCRMREEAPDLWPVLRSGVAGVVAATLLLQCVGVDQVLQATERNARLNAWLRAAPANIIVTPLQWLTVGSGALYFEKKLLLVQTPDDFHALVGSFAAARIGRWAYVPFSGSTYAPGAVTTWTESSHWRFRTVKDEFYQGMRMVTYAGSAASP